jgi:hypothetical protein
MQEFIPTGDAFCYVVDNSDNLLLVEFPRDIRVSRQTTLEIERRLQEFVKREVLPLLREEGIPFDEEQVDNTLADSPIWTYVLFGEVNRR